MEDLETIIMELLVNAGSARSSALTALQLARKGDFAAAEQAKLQAMADPFGKKVAVIDMMDYGMMKGDAVLDKALKLME